MSRNAASRAAMALVWVGIWCATAVAARAQEAEAGSVTPGVLLAELNAALVNPNVEVASPKWRSFLDLGFNNWRVHGSHNLPVIAAAVGLARSNSPTAYQASLIKAWWGTFLDCQNGTACAVANPGSLVYFKGDELSAYTYDWSVIGSVMAVHWWARANQQSALGDAARLYLRKTWSLYALSAVGVGILDYKDNLLNGALVDGDCPSCTHSCTPAQRGFDGPYLALAASRSNSSYICQDYKRVLFAHAIDWQPFSKPNPSWEHSEQKALRDRLVASWGALGSPLPQENVFGLTSAERTRIRDHIASGMRTAELLSAINGGGTRFIQVYRLLGWSDGMRLSVLERNPACGKCGGMIYASRFSPADRRAWVLYPWFSGNANGHRKGLAQIKSAAAPLPNRVEATNCDPAFDVCNPAHPDYKPAHGLHTVWFDLRTDAPRYHVVLGPSGPGVLLP